ncbi:hypothetical protein, unlikely [Trypanosoma brucei brucei TREU927]|uniref:Uncharacterized protein n=1 Tax=Trypanosoma brucei brucei (strain 927/4 GUTat10.1) TaxID=185431 RepID=Q4GYK4_TRYB2|nr:hypothetical protein, unlikely [Trypanosoma brucei brucei TREU927]CAJ16580.1 hypothetical protein, unlikely [Trypanosoma brucei brucei TREU927]
MLNHFLRTPRKKKNLYHHHSLSLTPLQTLIHRACSCTRRCYTYSSATPKESLHLDTFNCQHYRLPDHGHPMKMFSNLMRDEPISVELYSLCTYDYTNAAPAVFPVGFQNVRTKGKEYEILESITNA